MTAAHVTPAAPRVAAEAGCSRRERSRRERGASVVELAITLPVLLVVIGGLVDFGRAFSAQVILSNAAREGVRAAAVSRPLAEVTSRARAASTGATTPSVTVTVLRGGSVLGSSSCTPPDDDVRVTVRSSFTWLTLEPTLKLVGAARVLPTSLTSSATMRCGL